MATGDKLVNLDGLKAVYDDVHGDVSDLKSAVGKTIKVFDYTETSGYFDYYGNVSSASGTNQEKYTDKFSVDEGQSVYWEFDAGESKELWVACCYYDENQNIIGYREALFPAESAVKASGVITITSGVKYVAFTYRTYGVNGFSAFSYYTVDGLRSCLSLLKSAIGPLEVPALPSADGTYSLRLTVSGGAAAYAWAAE